MATSFFRRLGVHVVSFFTRQQDGNLTSGVGIITALLVYAAGTAGIPLTPDAAAAIVAAVMAAVAAGKRD